MSTAEILKELNHLSINEKLYIIEKTIKDILKYNNVQQLTVASEAMENDYKTNNELTAFSNLDMEDFYETK